MSLNSECGLIGGLLLDADAFYRVPDLQSHHFQKAENRRAFTTIKRLLECGEGVDVTTVEAAGGGTLAYLGQLASNTPGTANITTYASVIKEAARRRHVALSLKNALEQLSDGQPTEDIVQAVMTSMEQDQEHTARPFPELVADTLEHAEKTRRLRATNAVNGVSSTLPILNQLTGGFHGPKLIVTGGRPSTYKTAYALQVLTRAGRDGIPVGFISLEMGARELVTRAAANTMKVDGSELEHGDKRALAVAQGARAWDWPVHIEDNLHSWPDIVARVIGWRYQHDIQLAVIDYLQIIQVPGKASRFEKLGEISRGAKLLAKRSGIPIMLLAQISRDVERENRRPLLSDIRECGNVEQDADIVLFAHCQRQKDKPDQYEMILAKQRNGRARQRIRLQVNGAHYLIGEEWGTRRMNEQALETAARELTEIATRMFSDNPATVARIFELAAREIRQQLEQGTYLQAYAKFMRGTKPE